MSQAPQSFPKPASAWSNSLFVKLLLMAILMLGLLFPVGAIMYLVDERQMTADLAVAELSSSWGNTQTLTGPVIIVPYLKRIERVESIDEAAATVKEKKRIITETYYAYILPDSLSIEGEVFPERRARGIYEVALYKTRLSFTGSFPRIRNLFPQAQYAGGKGIAPEDILWNEATLSLGIPDMRGITESVILQWDNRQLDFEPGAGNAPFYNSGIHVALPLPTSVEEVKPHTFKTEVILNGSQSLSFLPVAKMTSVALKSTWKDPSFYGAFLPLEREVSEQGFTALWRVASLGRSFPQQWKSEDTGVLPNSLYESAFGLRLLMPVSIYQTAMRSVKYAVLFIVLTFVTFFIFELFNPIRIHPLQYLLVGFALCVFYLLLLSFSEQIGFDFAYLVSGAATVTLISAYSSFILKDLQRAFILGATLALLYGYLYILVQLQTMALLFGSLGLFFILALIMFITRKVDWYAVQLGASASPAESKP